jgi:hypothetical protein
MPRPPELRKSIKRNATFRLRAAPIPGDLRPIWRVSIILLMVFRAGHGGSISLKKAHILNWAVRTKQGEAILLRMISGERHLQDIPVRFDPALNRAIDFARGEGLLSVEARTTGSVLALTEVGKNLADKLYDDESCFPSEKQFFDSVRGQLPAPKVTELLEWETEL